MTTPRLALAIALLSACTSSVGCDGCGGAAAAPTDGGPGEGEGEGDGGINQPLPDGGPFQISDGGVLVTDTGPDGGVVTFVCQTVVCAGHLTACSNCDDDDQDGRTDFRDPECLGPCDETEGPGLESGVGGTSGNSCGVDCYFDYGNGPGNDDCFWDHRCDQLEPEDICAPYEASRLGTRDCPDTQSDTCAGFCRPLTPNGCDCFGCCDLGGGYVWIGNLDGDNTSTCTLADRDDPAACPPCTPVGNCLNECGRCELCVGRDSVPDDCFEPPPPAEGEGEGEGEPVDAGFVNPGQCADGVQACGLAGQADCPVGYFCITGCCAFVPG